MAHVGSASEFCVSCKRVSREFAVWVMSRTCRSHPVSPFLRERGDAFRSKVRLGTAFLSTVAAHFHDIHAATEVLMWKPLVNIGKCKSSIGDKCA